MIQDKLGEAVKGGAVNQGLAGAQPGSPATYVAIGHILFDSVQELQSAFAPHMEAMTADIPNFTDVQPTVQSCDVKM